MKAAGWGTEDAVKGIHEDLDGVAGHLITGGLGSFTAGKKLSQELAQNTGLTPK